MDCSSRIFQYWSVSSVELKTCRKCSRAISCSQHPDNPALKILEEHSFTLSVFYTLFLKSLGDVPLTRSSTAAPCSSSCNENRQVMIKWPLCSITVEHHSDTEVIFKCESEVNSLFLSKCFFPNSLGRDIGDSITKNFCHEFARLALNIT